MWIVSLLMSPGVRAEEQDWFDKGIKLMNQHRYDDAIKAFSTAIELIPRDYQAYNYRGVVQTLKGNFDEAIADYNQAIKIRPRFAEAFNNRGFAKTQRGDLRSAIEDYARALEINPFFVDAYNSQAWILATCADQRFRNGSKAIILAKKAVELKPDAGSFDTLAAAYAAAGNFEAAIDAQKKAIRKLILANRSSEVPKYMTHLNTYKSHQSLSINYAAAPKIAKVRTKHQTLHSADSPKAVTESSTKIGVAPAKTKKIRSPEN